MILIISHHDLKNPVWARRSNFRMDAKVTACARARALPPKRQSDEHLERLMLERGEGDSQGKSSQSLHIWSLVFAHRLSV